MIEEFLVYLWLGSVALSGLILLAGAIVPACPKRRLSDWAMLGGIVLSVLSFFAFLFLVVFEVYGHRSGLIPSDLWERLMMAAVFGSSGGLVIFSAGYLLSRFELRRERRQAEVLGQAGLSPQRNQPPGR